MGICSSVDVQKSPLSPPKRQPSSSSQARDLFAVQPATTSNQQGDGPADPPKNVYASDRDSAHQHRSDHHSSSPRHIGSHRQNSNHHQPSSHRYHPSPVHTADQAYHQSRHRLANSDRHRAVTDYRDDYRHRGESPHHGQRSTSHHHSSHHQSSDYYSSSPRSSHSSRFGSTRRCTVVPVTSENLQQHTRSYTTPKMHTVRDVIDEAVAEAKAARRSENFDISEEETYTFSEAGTKPFAIHYIPVKNDNGISSERSMARSRRRPRNGTSGALSSPGSDGGYPSYETQDSYGSSLPTGLHTPSYSRSRMRHMSQGSVGTVQSQFNGPIPAHVKSLHPGSSARLAAPGNPHNSAARSITDVPSIPEPHVAQHGHSNNVHLHPQHVSPHANQLMSSSRGHTSPHANNRSGTPQPNGNLDSHHQSVNPEGDQQHGANHLLDPRRGEVGGTNAQTAATPTSMYAQRGDATPPPHNLSSVDFGHDSRSSSRHPHASYVPNGRAESPVQALNGHMNHTGGTNSNGQMDKHSEFNQYVELDDEGQKPGGPGMAMHHMGHVEGLGYTAPQHKQPLHSLSESY